MRTQITIDPAFPASEDARLRARAAGRVAPWMRYADRLLGIPLLLGSSAMRRRRPLPRDWSHIGLLVPACIGDTVLLSAIAMDMRRQWPDRRLTIFTGPDNFQTALMIEAIDEVVQLPIHRPLAAISELRRRRLDVLLDFSAWPRISALLSRWSGAAWTAGFRTAGQARHYGYDQAVDHLGNVHELENYRSLARTLGVSPAAVPHLRQTSAETIKQAWGLPDDYLVFHCWSAGSQRRAKQWAAQRWCELARRAGELGLAVVLTGGPGDQAPSEWLERQAGSGRAVRNLAGRLSIEQTAAVASGARCVISVNTGIAHLAAAVGAHVICLEGSTSSHRWGPVGKRVTSVEAHGPGCGYIDLGFERPPGSVDCMSMISVDAVWTAVLQVLRHRGVLDARLNDPVIHTAGASLITAST